MIPVDGLPDSTAAAAFAFDEAAVHRVGVAALLAVLLERFISFTERFANAKCLKRKHLSPMALAGDGVTRMPRTGQRAGVL